MFNSYNNLKMKIMKKVLVGTIAALCFISSAPYSFAESVSITDVTVVDTRNVTATLDNDIDADKLTKEDIKVMHDIVISSVELDVADAKKATVFLASELRQNTIYNLISVFGMDGSMDFEIGSSLQEEEILNTSDEGIKSINIIDSKNLEVVYFDAITTNELELKLLEDMNIDSLQAQSNSSISVTTASDLEIENSYIFMLLSVAWLEWADVKVESGIYDFETTANITVASSNEVVEEEIVIIEEEIQNEDIVIESDTSVIENEEIVNEEIVNEIQAETEVDLNAAAEGNLSLDKNIDEVAASATEVPSTWAATGLLILLTLWATALVGFRKRK